MACRSQVGSRPVGGIGDGSALIARAWMAPASAAALAAAYVLRSGVCAPLTWQPEMAQLLEISGCTSTDHVTLSVAQKLSGYSSSSMS
ncbi:MAG: hypothetical protein IPK99_10030 [Flavobacteriales bacterium]|nr:hypothetical protein [Flavobacteriales bacterium]